MVLAEKKFRNSRVLLDGLSAPYFVMVDTKDRGITNRVECVSLKKAIEVFADLIVVEALSDNNR